MTSTYKENSTCTYKGILYVDKIMTTNKILLTNQTTDEIIEQ